MAGQIAYTHFGGELVRLGLLWRANGDWLEGPTWVVDYVMTVLAMRIMTDPHLRLSLVTASRSSKYSSAGRGSDRATTSDRRLRAVTRLLSIGPDANIDDIMKFRERHREELRQFRQFVEQLCVRSSNGDNDFDARLQQAETVRDHLERELRATRMSTSPITIALSAASLAAPWMENAKYSAIAGALGLGYAIYNYAGDRRRMREIMQDKLVYSALVSDQLRARRADDMLR